MVLGQDTFITCASNDDDQDGIFDANPTSRTLSSPWGVFALEDNLIVTDRGNNRFLIFESQ